MEQKMYKCHFCSYSSNQSFNLRKPENAMHNSSGIKKIYKCHDCPYSTNWPSNLRNHEKSMHNPSDI